MKCSTLTGPARASGLVIIGLARTISTRSGCAFGRVAAFLSPALRVPSGGCFCEAHECRKIDLSRNRTYLPLDPLARRCSNPDALHHRGRQSRLEHRPTPLGNGQRPSGGPDPTAALTVWARHTARVGMVLPLLLHNGGLDPT